MKSSSLATFCSYSAEREPLLSADFARITCLGELIRGREPESGSDDDSFESC